MAESCSKCSGKRLPKLCLTCHNFFCDNCIPVHLHRNRDHRFIHQMYSNVYKCLQHNEFARFFCTDCSQVICTVCKSGVHNNHRIGKIRNAPIKWTKEQSKKLERELDSVKAETNEVMLEIEKRQRYFDEFREKIIRIKSHLREQERCIGTLIFQQIQELEQLEGFNNLNKFFEQMNQLKLRQRFNKDLETVLRTILSESDISDFIVKIYGYLNNIKPFIEIPSIPHDCATLDINARIATVEELRSMLFTIRIGKCDIPLRQTGSSVNPDPSSARTMIKDPYDDETRILKKMIELMAENVGKFRDALTTKRSSTIVSFEMPRDLKDYPETEKHVERFYYSMKKIMRTIDDQRKTNRKQFEEMVEDLEKHRTSQKTAVDDADYQNKTRIETAEFQVKEMRRQSEELQDRIDSITEELKTAKRQLQHSENEKEDLKTRLSQMAGAKLIAGNSSITDLGDKYRPTRIAEMYSEMYDNEWTEAVDEIGQNRRENEEHIIIRHLFIVLQGCFKTCQHIAKENIDQLCRLMFLDVPIENLSEYCKSHFTEIRQLKDARKGMAYDVAVQLKEVVFNHSVFRKECSKYSEMNELLVTKVTKTKYAEKCTMICWFMVVQDPEMYLDEDLKKGIPLKKDTYKEYTKAGGYIDYSVWPALYLQKDGPLLIKGIAQCFN